MPIERLVVLLVVVIALAGATVAGVLALTGGSMIALAIVSLIALCAAYAARKYSSRS
ncbi:MAG: hypothetical protein AAFN63_05930 [Pseudomonadota bacterium]